MRPRPVLLSNWGAQAERLPGSEEAPLGPSQGIMGKSHTPTHLGNVRLMVDLTAPDHLDGLLYRQRYRPRSM